jgi:hypothetical protein
MKSLFRSIVLAGGMVVVASAHYASAQIIGSVEFTTSFPFTVGNTTVPAGSYTITPVDEDAQVLELSGAQTAVLFATESAEPKQTPSKDEIVFRHYGNGYVLKNVWEAGSNIGYVTQTALGERHLSKRGGTSTESRVAARRIASNSK